MNMLKKYEAPSLNVTVLEEEDVIMASQLKSLETGKLLTGGTGKIKYVDIE